MANSSRGPSVEVQASPEDYASAPDGKEKQVWHTLTACQRCRKRKTKCDPKLPRCISCEKSDAACIYWDSAKGTYMPRSYVVQLQSKVRQLESEVSALRSETNAVLPVEELVRSAGLVKIRENAESRFLGPSSGIAMTRLVMELARSLSHTKSIKEIVPEHMAREVKRRFESESAKPLSKIYPSISSVAAPGLPSFDLTTLLVNNFLAKAQIMYPVFHEPTFQEDVRDVYNGSTDPYKNFAVRIVIALSMHKTDTQWTGLADSFYLASLKYLEGTVRPRNLGTLQCFALIAQYSLATPTRTATYWVVGLAAKLLQELRMTDEATIGCDENGKPLDALETDLRRRLFYICVNMELALAHALGRPSAFSVTYDHKDIRFYSEVDDMYITSEGIVPDAQPTMKKRISIHFMKLRWLQLEIRTNLYLNKRTTPLNDEDPWFKQMEAKIDDWQATSPTSGKGKSPVDEFINVEHNTMTVFLFRPSPQVPEPSLSAVKKCFKASVENIYLQHAQVEAKAVDVSWVFAQQLFMAINTVLWALSYSGLRQEHSRSEVTRDLHTALHAIYCASLKWPGVESALTLYITLVDTCLKAYDGDAETSYGVASPSSRANAASPPSFDSPPPPATTPSSMATNTRPMTGGSASIHSLSRPQSLEPDIPTVTFQSLDPMNAAAPPTSVDHTAYLYGTSPASHLNVPSPNYSHSSFEQTSFDTNGFFNPLPSPLPYAIDQSAQQPNLFSHMLDSNFLMNGGTVDERSLPYFALLEPPMPMEGINLTQQEELLQSLETYGFGTPPSVTTAR